MIFHMVKYYQKFSFDYVIEVIAWTIFNMNFFKFIIAFHFYNTFINIILLLFFYCDMIW